MEFKEKFIAFIDILGFKDLVRNVEAGTGMALDDLLNVLATLGSTAERDRFAKHGPSTCPHSRHIERDLDFRVTQASDCAVVSVEISPAGVVNLVSHCCTIVMELLVRGLMCRGYITRGSIFHSDERVLGTGYQEACEKEKGVAAFKRTADERGTPFIEVDRAVVDYVKESGDTCIRKMFGRLVKDDGQTVALFPFQRLAVSFIIGPAFDPKPHRQSSQNLRRMLQDLRKRIMGFVDESRPDAVRKAKHYIRALDAQLEVCDRTDVALGVSPLRSPAKSGDRPRP